MAADPNINCILMDILMVRTDGATVCRELREAGCQLPIIAMTGRVELMCVFLHLLLMCLLLLPYLHTEMCALIFVVPACCTRQLCLVYFCSIDVQAPQPRGTRRSLWQWALT